MIRNLSALSVQKMWRGFKIRKMMTPQVKAQLLLYRERRTKAALVIQRAVRRHLTPVQTARSAGHNPRSNQELNRSKLSFKNTFYLSMDAVEKDYFQREILRFKEELGHSSGSRKEDVSSAMQMLGQSLSNSSMKEVISNLNTSGDISTAYDECRKQLELIKEKERELEMLRAETEMKMKILENAKGSKALKKMDCTPQITNMTNENQFSSTMTPEEIEYFKMNTHK